MKRFLVYLGLFVSAFLVSVAIPREFRQELSWSVLWDYDLPGEDGEWSEATGGSGDTSAGGAPDLFVVETDREYLVIGVPAGDIESFGLKGDVFTASTAGFINQPAEAQRWALQKWAGGRPRFVGAHGTPRMEGPYLLQVDDKRILYLTDMNGDDLIVRELADGASVYAVCTDCDSPMVVVGSMTGDMTVLQSEDSWSFSLEAAFGGEVMPPVYGVAALSAERIVVLYGTEPQQLALVEKSPENDGRQEWTVTAIHPINPDRAVSFPVGMDVSASRYVTVPLVGRAVVFDVQENVLIRLPVVGLTDSIVTVFKGPVFIAAASGMGVPVVMASGDFRYSAAWLWTDVTNRGFFGQPFQFVLQKDRRLIALGIALGVDMGVDL